MKRICSALSLLALFVGLLLLSPPASADGLPLSVSVGYADNSHCPTFNTLGPGSCVSPLPADFPNPWNGSPNTIFLGTGVAGVAFDSGALLLTNHSGAAVTVSDVNVTIGTNVFDLWGSFTIPNGDSAILTQYKFTGLNVNFDTSDTTPTGGGGACCVNDGLIPKIAITIGTTITTLSDTNQILNTGGSDLGCKISDCVSVDESHPWSLVFSPSPTTSATPEPGSLGLLGGGLVGLALLGAIHRKIS